ncbi:MAG TPA: hypothetical protein VKT77_07770 [Chthonomonadaceae bacterium]|nr:hypothetical protein [Chthonomonadaceae bacterium]
MAADPFGADPGVEADPSYSELDLGGEQENADADLAPGASAASIEHGSGPGLSPRLPPYAVSVPDAALDAAPRSTPSWRQDEPQAGAERSAPPYQLDPIADALARQWTQRQGERLRSAGDIVGVPAGVSARGAGDADGQSVTLQRSGGLSAETPAHSATDTATTPIIAPSTGREPVTGAQMTAQPAPALANPPAEPYTPEIAAAEAPARAISSPTSPGAAPAEAAQRRDAAPPTLSDALFAPAATEASTDAEAPHAPMTKEALQARPEPQRQADGPAGAAIPEGQQIAERPAGPERAATPAPPATAGSASPSVRRRADRPAIRALERPDAPPVPPTDPASAMPVNITPPQFEAQSVHRSDFGPALPANSTPVQPNAEAVRTTDPGPTVPPDSAPALAPDRSGSGIAPAPTGALGASAPTRPAVESFGPAEPRARGQALSAAEPDHTVARSEAGHLSGAAVMPEQRQSDTDTAAQDQGRTAEGAVGPAAADEDRPRPATHSAEARPAAVLAVPPSATPPSSATPAPAELSAQGESVQAPLHSGAGAQDLAPADDTGSRRATPGAGGGATAAPQAAAAAPVSVRGAAPAVAPASGSGESTPASTVRRRQAAPDDRRFQRIYLPGPSSASGPSPSEQAEAAERAEAQLSAADLFQSKAEAASRLPASWLARLQGEYLDSEEEQTQEAAAEPAAGSPTHPAASSAATMAAAASLAPAGAASDGPPRGEGSPGGTADDTAPPPSAQNSRRGEGPDPAHSPAPDGPESEASPIEAQLRRFGVSAKTAREVFGVQFSGVADAGEPSPGQTTGEADTTRANARPAAAPREPQDRTAADAAGSAHAEGARRPPPARGEGGRQQAGDAGAPIRAAQPSPSAGAAGVVRRFVRARLEPDSARPDRLGLDAADISARPGVPPEEPENLGGAPTGESAGPAQDAIARPSALSPSGATVDPSPPAPGRPGPAPAVDGDELDGPEPPTSGGATSSRGDDAPPHGSEPDGPSVSEANRPHAAGGGAQAPARQASAQPADETVAEAAGASPTPASTDDGISPHPPDASFARHSPAMAGTARDDGPRAPQAAQGGGQPLPAGAANAPAGAANAPAGAARAESAAEQDVTPMEAQLRRFGVSAKTAREVFGVQFGGDAGPGETPAGLPQGESGPARAASAPARPRADVTVAGAAPVSAAPPESGPGEMRAAGGDQPPRSADASALQASAPATRAAAADGARRYVAARLNGGEPAARQQPRGRDAGVAPVPSQIRLPRTGVHVQRRPASVQRADLALQTGGDSSGRRFDIYPRDESKPWAGLPAPDEPLPDVRTVRRKQAGPAVTAAASDPESGGASGEIVPGGAMTDRGGRDLSDPSDLAGTTPETEMEHLARRVYSVLKRKLDFERRRSMF